MSRRDRGRTAVPAPVAPNQTGSVTVWARERGRPEDRWRLEAGRNELVLTAHPGTLTLSGADVRRLSVRRGLFSASLRLEGATPGRFKGLPRREAPLVRAAAARVLMRHRVLPAVQAAAAWQRQVHLTVDRFVQEGRWLPQQTRQDLLTARPGAEVLGVLAQAGTELAALFDPAELEAVRFLHAPLDAWLDQRNEEILAAETARYRGFFDSVESKPLTHEQIRAVVSFDNRVQVVAAAGSGKTSVMVARAAYAVLRGFVAAEEVLLLAFNKAAAVELQERVERGLAAVGLPSGGVKATTFHAYGLSVLGQATARKPRPAWWLDGGQDIGMVCRIVDELRDTSPGFGYRWDLFRLLYARASETVKGGEPDGYDTAMKTQGYRTANGEVVKSEGERMIADFLFFNGVAYSYERPYDQDTATSTHSQYLPDFHYDTPNGAVWHEHWALDANGQPPPDFSGYLESMAWKRALHAEHDTVLLETTWAQVMRQDGLVELADDLRRHGLELDWNPDRRAPGAQPLQHKDLARLIRTFMSHVKSNSLSRADLEERITRRTPAGARGRSRLFLDLYWQIAERWDAKLAADGSVDFEDMIVAAADHLEAGRIVTPWRLVLVDEFQDASRARARLTRALVNPPGRHLLVVGDDWQSINRFAGADISVMTGFSKWFGPGPSLKLQTTFRSPQTLADTASAFVSKNPQQLSKEVRSAQALPGCRVRLIVASAADYQQAELYVELHSLAKEHRSQPATVLVLGRYNFDSQHMPRDDFAGLDVTFRTVHSSKGLEADYVIILNVTSGTYGFPSAIRDDAVLSLALADADEYPHAEERRLFYVALTRARRHVTLVTVQGRESPFIAELLQDERLDVIRAPGPPPEPCPTCGKGILIHRNGPYSPFLGCSTFPRCRHITRLQTITAYRRPGEPPF